MAFLGLSKQSMPVELLLTAKDQASGEVKKLSYSIQGLNQQTQTASLTAGNLTGSIFKSQLAMKAFDTAVEGVRRSIGFLGESLMMGAKLEMMNVGLEVIARNAGISDEQLQGMVTSLEEINTYGSNATLTIKSFVQSGLVDLVQNVRNANGKEGFPAFIETVKDFAASVGVSSSDAIQTFSKAILQQNVELLDTYGITTNLIEIYKRQADALGKNTNELTEMERRQALLNFIMEEGTKVAGVYQETYDTAGKNMLSFDDTIVAIKENLGLALQPAIVGVTNKILEMAKELRNLIIDNQPQIEEFSARLGDLFENAIDKIGEAIQKTAEWWAENKDEMIPKLQELAQTALDAGTAIITIVTSIGKFLIDHPKFSEALAGIITAFVVIGKVIAIGKAISGAVTAITAFFAEGATGAIIVAKLGAVLSFLGGILSTVFTAIGTVISGIATAIVGFLGTISAPVWALIALVAVLVASIYIFRDQIVAAWEWIVDRWNNAGQILKDNWNAFTKWITEGAKEIWSQLTTFFTEMWDSITTSFNNFWIGIQTWFTNVGTAISDFFTGIYEAIVYFKDNWAYILGQLVGSIVAFVDNAIKRWQDFKAKAVQAIQDTATAVGNWFSSLPQRVADWMKSVIEKVSTAWNNFWTVTTKWLSDTFTAIGKWFSELPQKIATWLTQTVNTISTAWNNAYNAVTNWLSKTYETLRDWFSQLPSRIANWVSNTVRVVSEGFANMWNGIVNGIGEFWNRAKSNLAWVGDRVKEWGSNTIRAVADAIINAPASVMGAIKKFWNDKIVWNINSFIEGFNDKSPVDINWRMPYLAEGGVVKARTGGTVVKVAEGGEDEVVAPLSKLNGMGIGGGVEIHMHMDGMMIADDLSKDQLARDMVQRFFRQMKQLGYSNTEEIFNKSLLT